MSQGFYLLLMGSSRAQNPNTEKNSFYLARVSNKGTISNAEELGYAVANCNANRLLLNELQSGELEPDTGEEGKCQRNGDRVSFGFPLPCLNPILTSNTHELDGNAWHQNVHFRGEWGESFS